MSEQTVAAPLRARRQQLVQIAREVLERDGFAHLSIGEIAREAGIKPPSLYKQFDGKADIESALVEHGLEVLAHEFETSLSETVGATPAERMRHFVGTFRRFGHSHPQLYLLMNSRPVSQHDPALGDSAAGRLWVDVFSAALGDHYSAEVGMSTWAWAHGILSLELVSRVPDADAAWAMFLGSVGTLRSAR